MATKSFLKNIVIKDKKSAIKFIDALEKEEKKKRKKVKTDKLTEDVTDSKQIRKIFGK